MGRHNGDDIQALRASVNNLIFEANTQLTALTTVQQDARDTAQQILALNSHDADMLNAGGFLLTHVPDKIDELIMMYRLVIRNMEHYISRL